MTATPRVDGAKTLLERDVVTALRSRRRELALRALQQAEDALREKLGSGGARSTVIELRRALRDRDSTA